MWFSQSGNYINKPAIIEIYTCNHVGIWLQFIDKKQRGVVCLVAAIYEVIGPSVDISKLFDRPANPGQFLVVNRFLPAEIPNALMSTDRPTTDKKKLSFDGWAMIDGWSTDSSTTALTEEIDHRKKIITWPDGHKISRPTKKRGRTRQRQWLMNCRLLPNKRIPFLLKTRLPLVVFFLNMTSLGFK